MLYNFQKLKYNIINVIHLGVLILHIQIEYLHKICISKLTREINIYKLLIITFTIKRSNYAITF